MKIKRTVVMLKVFLWVVAAVFVMQLIFTIIPKIPVKIQTSLFALRLPVIGADTDTMYPLRWYIFICAVPAFALCFFVILKLIALLKPIGEGNPPFTLNNVKIIRSIGFSFLIYTLISTIIGYIGAKLILGSLLDIFTNWNIELDLPVASIATGAILLSLGEIFSQGLALKQDNDSIV